MPPRRRGFPRPVTTRTREQAAADDRFAQYVLPEVDVLLRVARSLTRTTADAEDLVQETLLRAYRGIDRFDGRHPRAWLLTILRNAERNRHRRRRPQLLDDPEESERLADADHEPSPEDVAVADDFTATVVAAYRDLPDPFRQVAELVDVQGLSYAEASEALGIKVGTVMSRLHRARRRIRERLDREGLGPRRAP